jgi:hypothetical protein
MLEEFNDTVVNEEQEVDTSDEANEASQNSYKNLSKKKSNVIRFHV